MKEQVCNLVVARFETMQACRLDQGRVVFRFSGNSLILKCYIYMYTF